MKISKSLYYQFTLIICLFTIPSLAIAQICDATTLEEFYECYGGESEFSPHSISAITTFIQAEDAIHQGDYAMAENLINTLFDTYPQGSNIWWNVFSGINGSNIGSPHAYYGLRMMEDIIDHHLNTDVSDIEVRKVNMTVVLVGCSEGIQPTNLSELNNGTGSFVTNNLDPALSENDYHIVKQSYDLFTRYVHAITKGQVEVDVEIIELPQLCMEVSVNTSPPYVASGPISATVWNTIDEAVRDSTDFWVLTYPSHVPEYPAFDDLAFITGGMGQDSKGGPVFIADDKWIVRKPAHLGAGTYSDIERRIYLPQWYQHEFFHHIFRLYPEYELEVNGHDWFDPDFWPDDFEGRFETDFYFEALHKRIQIDCVPLATKLITRVQNIAIEPLSKLSIDELLGAYSLNNIQNNWHEGEILKAGNQYFWRNAANVQWEVFPDITAGQLNTGADCPYPGQDFFLELYQTVDGSYLPGVVALKFQGDEYRKRFNLLRETVAFEIALGEYTRVPYESMLHAGTINKESGQLSWKNEANDSWSLSPDVLNESFSLGADSPSPEEDFQLIFNEGTCELSVLGFKYLNYYYWREKRDVLNASPILVNPIADLELEENFNSQTIDLSSVFSDPEGDLILHFATSTASDLIEATIENEQLILTGGQATTVTIYISAIDPNGGLATDEFTIQVGDPVSTQELDGVEPNVSIFPNPAQNYFIITGELSQNDISIYSANGTFLEVLSESVQGNKIDLSNYDPGLYFVRIINRDSGQTTLKKLVKFLD